MSSSTAAPSSAPSSSPKEMASFHSAFQADDSLITILPSFDSTEPLPLLSSLPAGPFQAGLPSQVPVWMALLLHQRSLCTISPPEWLTQANLSEIITFEKQNQVLFDDAERLPRHYYELANRLTGRKGIVFESNSTAQVLSLLVQDLFELRLDKLRQQLPSILENNSAEQLILTINGISTQELAIFRPFVQQALNDRDFLMNIHEPKQNKGQDELLQGAKEAMEQPKARPRQQLRRFRR